MRISGVVAGCFATVAAAASAASSTVDRVSAVIDRQLRAYNAGDAVAFAETYHPAATVCNPDKGDAPVLRGREAIRTRYGALFASRARPHVVIVARVHAGNYITDHERIVGTGAEALVTYEVRDGLITRAWIHTVTRP